MVVFPFKENTSHDHESSIPQTLEPAFESSEVTSIGDRELSLATRGSHNQSEVFPTRIDVSAFHDSIQFNQSLTPSIGLYKNDRRSLPAQTFQSPPSGSVQMSSTPQNLMKPLTRAMSELSLTSVLTTSSMRSQLLKGSNIKASFSPKSRKRIIDSAKFAGGNKNSEPIFYNALLTSCSDRCSVIDLSRSVFKLQHRNRITDTLETGDRVLIEFKGGLVLEDGSSIAILEGSVITTSSGRKHITVVEHEAVNFSLRGGAISVNVFLVNRLYYEKKYHQLAITGLTELRVECTLRVVQGPPHSAKIAHIFTRIRETIPQNSRVLIIGTNVRERVSLPSYCNFLNLHNLRLSKERAFDTEEQAENVKALRGCHFEYRDQVQKLETQLEFLCTDYSDKIAHMDHKASRMQEIQETVLKLEALKDLLAETDMNLALEAFSDVTVIYGTIDDVANTQSLLAELAPSVSVVLDAESLDRWQLAAVFRVRKGHLYLACDTPFFWDAVTEWRVKETSSFMRKCREPISADFIQKLEAFIDTEKIDFHFFSSRSLVQSPSNGLFLLQTCFKHEFPKCVTKAQSPKNVVFIRHSLKDEEAAQFELNFIADLRRFFIMRGDHDHFGCSVDANGNLQEAQTSHHNGVKLPGIAQGNGLFRRHTQTLVSLNNMSAKTLQDLYTILKCTTREFFMVGNLNHLKRTDECVAKFLANLEAAGLVRRNIVFTCPKHNCDVLLGEGKDHGINSGCQEICNVPLSCGHPCLQKCHFHDDQTFDETWSPCRERCNIILPCRHRCPFTCGKPCIDRCQVKVRQTLSCGHRVHVECWDSESSEITCPNSKCHRKSDTDKMNGSHTSTGFFSRMLHPF